MFMILLHTDVPPFTKLGATRPSTACASEPTTGRTIHSQREEIRRFREIRDLSPLDFDEDEDQADGAGDEGGDENGIEGALPWLRGTGSIVHF